MNFIENIFGLYPDGGSGALELLLFLIPIAGITAIRFWQRRKAARRSGLTSHRNRN